MLMNFDNENYRLILIESLIWLIGSWQQSYYWEIKGKQKQLFKHTFARDCSFRLRQSVKIQHYGTETPGLIQIVYHFTVVTHLSWNDIT